MNEPGRPVFYYQAPGAWADRAACTGHGPEMFLPDRIKTNRQHSAKVTRIVNRAKLRCATCPVLDQCREWALTTPDPAHDAIAGGLTPWERRNIRRERGDYSPEGLRHGAATLVRGGCICPTCTTARHETRQRSAARVARWRDEKRRQAS